jgi:polyferredoxin
LSKKYYLEILQIKKCINFTKILKIIKAQNRTKKLKVSKECIGCRDCIKAADDDFLDIFKIILNPQIK